MPEVTPTLTHPLPVGVKARLAVRVWWLYGSVHLALLRHPLPVVVARLSRGPRARGYRLAAKDLGRIVRRVLRVGSRQPRCLFKALVLYRLLWAQGDVAELVIGLPATPTGKEAHAWVEVERVDVGPPPGGHGHVELARYGGPPSVG
jgi:Transglutaminase-like superfamily